MNIVTSSIAGPLPLGKQGERGVTQVHFDLSRFIEQYGEGIARLTVKRPGEAVEYAAAVKRRGTAAVWEIGGEWTEKAGAGECELSWYMGSSLAKSVTYRTQVLPGMGKGTQVPEPRESYLDAVQAAGVQAEQAAYRAQEEADRAETAAAQAQQTVNRNRADWEQQDPAAADHIRNRPFYKMTLLPERSIYTVQSTTVTGAKIISSPQFAEHTAGHSFELVDGGDYILSYDGIEYGCKAFSCTGGGGVSCTAMGNPRLILTWDRDALIPQGAGAEVPFAVFVDEYGNGVFCHTTAGVDDTHTVAICSVKKLPNEYLDEDYIREVAGQATGISVEDDGDGNIEIAVAGGIAVTDDGDGNIVIM